MNKRTQRLLIGAIIGSVVGIAAAKMIDQTIAEAEFKGKKATIKKNPTDWLKLTAAIVSVLRQLSSLFTA